MTNIVKGIDYTGITTVFLCYDQNYRILMGKRSTKCRDEQGKWDIGGGSLEFGLTLEENLKKEIKEEYCCDILKYEFIGYRDVFRESNGKKTHWLAMHFKVLVDPSQVRIGEPESIDEIGWFTLKTLPSPIHSQAVPFFEKFKAELKEFE